jgi:hypothetical protein
MARGSACRPAAPLPGGRRPEAFAGNIFSVPGAPSRRHLGPGAGRSPAFPSGSHAGGPRPAAGRRRPAKSRPATAAPRLKPFPKPHADGSPAAVSLAHNSPAGRRGSLEFMASEGSSASPAVRARCLGACGRRRSAACDRASLRHHRFELGPCPGIYVVPFRREHEERPWRCGKNRMRPRRPKNPLGELRICQSLPH